MAIIETLRTSSSSTTLKTVSSAGSTATTTLYLDQKQAWGSENQGTTRQTLNSKTQTIFLRPDDGIHTCALRGPLAQNASIIQTSRPAQNAKLDKWPTRLISHNRVLDASAVRSLSRSDPMKHGTSPHYLLTGLQHYAGTVATVEIRVRPEG